MAQHLHPSFRKIPWRWRFRYGFYQYLDHFLGRKTGFKLTGRGRRKFYKRLGAWLKEGGKATIVEVERRENISDEELYENYIKKGIPVVVSGKAKDWSCVQDWSLDYFKDLHGDDKVIFTDQYNIRETEHTETTLGDVIDKIKNGQSEYYRFYPLLKKHPEHLMDFDFKWLRKQRKGVNFGEAFQVFISSKGGYTPVHNAGAHNLFTQVYGEKSWYLYPVQYTCIIDPDPTNNIYRNAPKRAGTIFNPFEADFTGHEYYEYMDGYKVTLKPGDVFYNAPYMWHCVKNPTDSIGVGYRYYTPFNTYFKNPLYSFLELFTFRPPIWKSWRNFEDMNIIHLAETGQLKKVTREQKRKEKAAAEGKA